MEDVLNSFDASHNILNIFHPCEGTERTTSWIKTFCLRSFYSDKKFLNLGLNRICKTFKHSPLVKEEKITHLFLSDPIPKSLLLTWLMWPWRVKIHATSQCHATSPWVFFTESCQTKHVPEIRSKFWSYSFFQDCEAMLLMPEPNKTHIVDVGTKQKPCRYARIKQY